MTIEQILEILENYKLRIPPTVFYDLKADIVNFEEPTTKNDLGVDAISRIETIDYLCKHCPDDGECFKDCDEIKHLRNLPSVTPQPKTGHWIEHEHNGIAHIECSECSYWFLKPHLIRNSYCPNCGAKMTETEG